MPIFQSNHPLIKHKMTALRDRKTSNKDFRQLVREVTFFLGYEATKYIPTDAKEVVTPMGVSAAGDKVSDNVCIVPILRAGLGMADGMSELLPNASVHHIGMYREKQSLLPIQYYNKLPKDATCDIAYVVDPCIATSNTISAVVSIIKRWGAKKIVVVSCIGAKSGVDQLVTKHPDVDVYIGAIDDVLSPEGMIIPGLGDAGDRQFGTPSDEVPDLPSPTGGSPSKRAKR